MKRMLQDPSKAVDGKRAQRNSGGWECSMLNKQTNPETN